MIPAFIAVMTSLSPADSAPTCIRKIWFVAVLALSASSTFTPMPALAYVLEGPSWPNGSTPAFQMELGNASRTLSDGNTSWDNAAVPALTMWNQQRKGVQLNPGMGS